MWWGGLHVLQWHQDLELREMTDQCTWIKILASVDNVLDGKLNERVGTGVVSVT